jgi:hypothetical protein
MAHEGEAVVPLKASLSSSFPREIYHVCPLVPGKLIRHSVATTAELFLGRHCHFLNYYHLLGILSG